MIIKLHAIWKLRNIKLVIHTVSWNSILTFSFDDSLGRPVFGALGGLSSRSPLSRSRRLSILSRPPVERWGPFELDRGRSAPTKQLPLVGR